MQKVKDLVIYSSNQDIITHIKTYISISKYFNIDLITLTYPYIESVIILIHFQLKLFFNQTVFNQT